MTKNHRGLIANAVIALSVTTHSTRTPW